MDKYCRNRFCARRLLVAFMLGTTAIFFAVLASTQANLRIVSSPSVTSVTPESCNGRDDDGDGQIDEGLGTFSAGLGVCRTTVPACTNGQIGIPGPGAPSTESCNGLDDDCDGEIDEIGCAAVHVSPFGTDATANGTTSAPFRTIQAAINFVVANASQPRQIQVAASASCGTQTTFNYNENVVMANGISVYGGYQAVGTSWPRCAGLVTRIVPTVAEGVRFPATVVDPTILSGFTIGQPTLATTSGVTVDGAQNVMLNSLVIPGASNVQRSYGVNIINGGQATVTNSNIFGGAGTVESIGVRVVNSLVTVTANCTSPFNATSQCFKSATLGNIGIHGRAATGTGESYPVLLDNSPASVVERTSLHSNGGDTSAGVRVKGNGAGVRVHDNYIAALGASQDAHGVWAEDCGDATPWVVHNFSISVSGTNSNSRASGVRAMGSCHPVIEANTLVSGPTESSFGFGDGIRCGLNASLIASNCVVDNNSIRGGGTTSAGVFCEDQSCGRIERNTFSKEAASSPVNSIGIRLGLTSPLVERNVIVGGCGSTSSTGIMATGGGARIANNFINGAAGCSNTPATSTGVLVVNTADATEIDLHSNTIAARDTTNGNCTSVGLQIDASPTSPPTQGKGIVRNNIIHGGDCANARYGVREVTSSADPRVFENNDIVPAGATTALYLNEGSTAITTAAGVNALTDMTVSNTVAVDPLFVSYPTDLHLQSGSPVRNAGTSQAAPDIDIDGDLRDPFMPDMGADEVDGPLLLLLAITQENLDIVVSFEGVADRTYRLERKSAMTDPSWQSIPGVNDLTLPASGATEIADPGAIDLGRAFYRVSLLP